MINSQIGNIFSFIHVRDRLLDLLTYTRSDNVINPRPGQDLPAVPHQRLPSLLKQALDEIFLSGISSDGEHVDYAAIRNSKAYSDYCRECSPMLYRYDPDILDTRQKKLAFWINLYNALIIDAVIAFDIRTSVTDGFIGILSFFRRAAYSVCGQRMSCDDIEHGILRGNRGHPFLPGKQFSSNDQRKKWVIEEPDPRIHFALNCASRSCPPIQFYTPERIDDQLDQAAINFINIDVSIDKHRKEITLSEIFKWYSGDFGGQEGVIKVIAKYHSDADLRNWLVENQHELQFTYKKYDWGLNL